MSAPALTELLARMEGWLSRPAGLPDPDELGRWNADLQAALASEARGADWSALVARAQALGAQVTRKAEAVAQARDAIRAELEAQGKGDRALRGYGAAAR